MLAGLKWRVQRFRALVCRVGEWAAEGALRAVWRGLAEFAYLPRFDCLAG